MRPRPTALAFGWQWSSNGSQTRVLPQGISTPSIHAHAGRTQSAAPRSRRADAVRQRVSENIYVDLDAKGNLVSMTIEHARANARLQEFSFVEVTEQAS